MNKLDNAAYHIAIIDADIIADDIKVNAIADTASDDLSFSVKLNS